jgi:hypothetical protein
MLDPFPPPPRWLRNWITPLAESFNLYSLPYHIHEVIFTFAFYVWVHFSLSPRLSTILFPRHYPKLPAKTRRNWDVHVVSFVQSTIVNTVALWVMFKDQERNEMSFEERIYGYTGASGLAQAMATGYFLYDLIVSTIYIKTFGIGMFLHGLSAVFVFTLGFVSIKSPILRFIAPHLV